jgi:uncharacterized membrane protein HdeD (DUF308 family)
MSTFAIPAEDGERNRTTFGIIAIVLGILAMLAPGFTGVSIALLVGVFVLIGGIVRMIWAFRARSLGRWLLTFSIGILTFLCGILLLAQPLFTTGALTILLAVYFIIDGVFEMVGAFQARPRSGWGWMLFGGIVSLLLGIMIWRQFPLSGVWAIGTLLGIKLFFIGLIMITEGKAVESAMPA